LDHIWPQDVSDFCAWLSTHRYDFPGCTIKIAQKAPAVFTIGQEQDPPRGYRTVAGGSSETITGVAGFVPKKGETDCEMVQEEASQPVAGTTQLDLNVESPTEPKKPPAKPAMSLGKRPNQQNVGSPV
jgi:hypothetical protein